MRTVKERAHDEKKMRQGEEERKYMWRQGEKRIEEIIKEMRVEKKRRKKRG